MLNFFYKKNKISFGEEFNKDPKNMRNKEIMYRIISALQKEFGKFNVQVQLLKMQVSGGMFSCSASVKDKEIEIEGRFWFPDDEQSEKGSRVIATYDGSIRINSGIMTIGVDETNIESGEAR